MNSCPRARTCLGENSSLPELPEQAERTTAWKVKSGCRSMNPSDSAKDPELKKVPFGFDVDYYLER